MCAASRCISVAPQMCWRTWLRSARADRWSALLVTMRPVSVCKTGLRELGAQDQCLIVDESRPSTTKTRIIAHSQLVVRADRESRIPVNGKFEEKIVSCLKDALKEADAFVVSDYDKGVVTPRILREILPLAYERVPVLIDPKLRNFNSYRPATLVTPNHLEALRMSDTEDHFRRRIASRRESDSRETRL